MVVESRAANRTEVPFITADQPAINLKGARPHPTEALSIYYPISPRLALLLADVDEEPLFATEGLTAAQASMLNFRTLTERTDLHMAARSTPMLYCAKAGSGSARSQRKKDD